MTQSPTAPHEISVGEAAIILCYHHRSVRRLVERGKIKARIEKTQGGREWFLDSNSVDEYFKKIKNEKERTKHQKVLQDDIGHDRGQPRLTDPHFDYIEKIEAQNKELQDKNAELQNKLLVKSEEAAYLKGEKIGIEQRANEQRALILQLTEKIVALQLGPGSASVDRGQVINPTEFRKKNVYENINYQ